THQIKGKVNYEAGSPEMFANACFEEEYREWLLAQVKEYRQYPKLEAVNAGAEQVGCSPLTSARYLSKLLSESGPLELVKSPYGLSVTFKRWYQGDE
ncbi:MAG: hypothetical protein GY852_08490, partial [bacterium]|nr:hypothetical protein [bacterium]